jgi:hypothetical protein
VSSGGFGGVVAVGFGGVVAVAVGFGGVVAVAVGFGGGVVAVAVAVGLALGAAEGAADGAADGAALGAADAEAGGLLAAGSAVTVGTGAGVTLPAELSAGTSSVRLDGVGFGGAGFSALALPAGPGAVSFE